MEIAGWLQRLLPDVEPVGDGPCWVAWAKTRTPEHHPPFYWLGRALDAVEDAGATEMVGARLLAAHGPGRCPGWSEQDERAQDVLSEACALAWVSQHLGRAEPVPAGDGRLLLHVPAIEACVAPRRLWPARTLEALLDRLGEQAAGAAADLDAATCKGSRPDGGRLLYLDLSLDRRAYARDVGYDGPLTEPVRAWLEHQCAEHRLGWVLTRPFQWGVPLEAWY